MPITDARQLTPLEDLFNAATQEAKDYADSLFTVVKPHIFRAQSSGESLPNNTQTKLSTFGTVIDSATDITYSAGDWTIAVTGVYAITGAVGFTSNATGDRRAYIYRGGSIIAKAAVNANTTSDTVLTIPAPPVRLYAGDVISLRALQTSGSSLTTVAGDTQLAISWLHP